MTGELNSGVDPGVATAFNNAMREIYRRAKVEAGYNATVFLQMLANQGPLETARRLIHTDHPSDGFVQLWQRRRLDLTVEAQVLQARFGALFTDDERAIAIARLHQYDVSDDDIARWQRT